MASQKRKLVLKLNCDPFANQETRFLQNGIPYTPTDKRRFMSDVSDALRKHNGYFEGVKFIRAVFKCYCKRIQSKPKDIPLDIWRRQVTLYKNSKPDGDNYLKPLQDSLSNHAITSKKNKAGRYEVIKRGAGIIDDDAVLVDTRVIKLWCKPGMKPHVIIKLVEIDMIYEH